MMFEGGVVGECRCDKAPASGVGAEDGGLRLVQPGQAAQNGSRWLHGMGLSVSLTARAS